MTVSVLTPFRPDGGRRDELLRYTTHRLQDALREAKIKTQMVILGDGAVDGLFNRGAALNNCARLATGSVYLIADADTTYGTPIADADITYGTPNALTNALRASLADRRWRLPARYVQLTEAVSNDLMAKDDLYFFGGHAQIDTPGCEWIGEGVCWSGLVIVPAEAWELVRGGDERYIGHGADDVALGLALDTLYGKHVRYPGDAVHLWHPRGDQEENMHEFSVGQRELTERYMAAADDPAKMAAIVGEKPSLRFAGCTNG